MSSQNSTPKIILVTGGGRGLGRKSKRGFKAQPPMPDAVH
jgi:NAD(P)-dependent dehydrogenase (short-subunit alcohol dehydrogenase family)